MGQYRAQFVSMIIMIALGVGIFLGFNMEWYAISVNTGKFFSDTGFADYRVVSQNGFSKADAEKIARISGVDSASRYISVNVDVKDADGDTVALTVTENARVSGFAVTSGKKYDPNSLDGIWLSDSYAAANGISPGDSMTFVYGKSEVSGKVEGLVKSGEYLICVVDETQIMPNYDSFGYAYISPKMYEKAMGYAYFPQINVISGLDKQEFIKQADKTLGSTLMILSKDEVISYFEAKGEENEGKTMGSVLPVVFLAIAVLTMITTMHRLTAKEKTQIGTLKALGFKDRVIARHYTSYALFIGVVGSAAGVGLGYFLAWFIMNPKGAMGTYFDMPEWKLPVPAFCIYIIVGIIFVLTFIGWLSVRKMLNGSAADSLRPYTPKKVRAMLIEKTSFFHKLPFGIRWNMRDTVRHKSRTAMSLLGVMGCAVLIIASFGMRDTIDYFVDGFFDKAMNYSSRIFLADDATEKQREAVIDKYKGDWSSSISVQLGDKPVSLDIYCIQNGLVGFLDGLYDKTKLISLTDDGAYISKRIADDNSLEIGDKLTVSPYGSDKEYTVKVKGIIRSLTESIVITPGYAEKIGIHAVPDSVYTAAKKSDIHSSKIISSVQTKESIVTGFDNIMLIMNTMIAMLIVVAVILGVVVLYNLGVMSYTERCREMATLKVVGFGDKKIGRILLGQNMWISLLGVILGLPLGVWVLKYLMVKLASEYEIAIFINPLTYIISAAMCFGVSLIVSLMVGRKNKEIDMVEALKGAE